MPEKEMTELILSIATKSGKTPEEITQMVTEKTQKFAGLLTEQGAAYLIEKELGLHTEVLEHVTIAQLTQGMKSIEVKGTVIAIYPTKEFEKNGKKGKLQSFLLSDDSGEVRVTLWNDQVDTYRTLRQGSELTVTNGIVSLYNEKKQLALGFGGSITITSQKEVAYTKLSDLKAGMTSVCVIGKLMRKFPTKDFASGERKGKFCNFQFGDETALLRATAWNEKAEEIDGYTEGDVIEISNAYTKEGRSGIELNLGYSAGLRLGDKDITHIPTPAKEVGPVKKIHAMIEGESATLVGKITDIWRGNLHYLVCEKCGKKVKQSEIDPRIYVCDTDGEVKTKRNAVVSLVIEDDTGIIRANLFGELALKALHYTQEELDRKLDTNSANVLLEELKTTLVGRDVQFAGYVKISSFSGEREFTVRDILA